MKPVDMSARAVTARLKRVAQLRRLCLSLQKAKLPAEETKVIDVQRVTRTKPKTRTMK